RAGVLAVAHAVAVGIGRTGVAAEPAGQRDERAVSRPGRPRALLEAQAALELGDAGLQLRDLAANARFPGLSGVGAERPAEQGADRQGEGERDGLTQRDGLPPLAPLAQVAAAVYLRRSGGPSPCGPNG